METLERPVQNVHTRGRKKMKKSYQLADTETNSNGAVTIADSKEYLAKRGISSETARKAGVEISGDTLHIRYLVNGEAVNTKYRSIAEKKFWQDGGKQVVWNYDVLKLDGTLYITEGEIDALSLIECGHEKAISAPNGGTENNNNLDWLYDIYDQIPEDVVLCFDNDNVGHSLLQDVSAAIGKARCRWVKYPKGCKDFNDTLAKFGKKGVDETIKRAAWIDVKGHYKMSELPPVPYRQPMAAGMGALDNHMKLRLGDFSVLTGIPGQGKTTFANDFINRVLEKYDLKACFASFENPPQTDHRRALRTWKIGKYEKDMTEDEKSVADKWIDDRYMFIVPDESDDVTLEWLIERMEVVVLRHGVRIIVIDPWNEMDHRRPNGMTLTEYTGNAIRILKSFAKSRGVHVMVVAHPAKMLRAKDGSYPVPTLYDISDSQHWANKADLGIVVHRGEDGDTVRCVKSRFHTEIGTPGVVDVVFNPQTGRFSDTDHSVWKK